MIAMAKEVKPLREWRRAHAWSVEVLAVRAGVSSRTVWSFERGQPVREGTLRKIADALGIEPRQIEEAKR